LLISLLIITVNSF